MLEYNNHREPGTYLTLRLNYILEGNISLTKDYCFTF